MDVTKDGKPDFSICYLFYETDLPFDPSLFEPPPDLKITAQRAVAWVTGPLAAGARCFIVVSRVAPFPLLSTGSHRPDRLKAEDESHRWCEIFDVNLKRWRHSCKMQTALVAAWRKPRQSGPGQREAIR